MMAVLFVVKLLHVIAEAVVTGANRIISQIMKCAINHHESFDTF